MNEYRNERRIGPWIGYLSIVGLVVMTGAMVLQDRPGRPQLTVSAASVATTRPTTAPTTTVAEGTTTTPPTTTAVPVATARTLGTVPGSTTTPSSATVSSSPVSSTPESSSPSSSTPGTVVDGTPEAPSADEAERSAIDMSLGYPAAPDGSPLPVIVTYDTDAVRLAGAVPSEDARALLTALALANSRTSDAELIDGLIVNPSVPATVGVRVIERDSPRFGEGDIALTAEHAAQIDRAANLLLALPHVSVLVIGHADQRGDDLGNLALSEARAAAVVDYLTYLGIEPTRISMRGAGETDLLTLADDDAALALNRRTEFVFSGIMLTPPA